MTDQNDIPKMSEDEIKNLKADDPLITELIEKFEEDTGKKGLWKGEITKSFKRWLRGEKIYDKDKERISLYVSEEMKKEWIDFANEKGLNTISKLIRKSVENYMRKNSISSDTSSISMNQELIRDISHALKEPLTSIKGFSQFLLKNPDPSLKEEIISTINNIFEQSVELENKIVTLLDDINIKQSEIDVILIEDDLPTIRLITTYLKSKGLECKGVTTANKGIQLLKKISPKLILLDIILPDINGYDLCKRIKSDKNLKDIPVIFITAIPESEVKKDGEDFYADGLILKPFDLSVFEDLIEEYL